MSLHTPMPGWVGVLADGGGDYGGGGTPWWVGLITPQVILIIVVIVLILVLTVGIVAFLAYRRVRRSPALHHGLLALQAQYEPPGPHRDVQQLRLRVQETTESLARALALPGELPSLARRLQHLASATADQLALLAGEPDDQVLERMLPPARARVDELESATSRLRQAALGSEAGASGEELAGVSADVDREVLALQEGVATLQRLTSGGGLSGGPAQAANTLPDRS